MRKGCTLIFNNIGSKYSQWRSFSESKPVPCTNSFRKTRLSILASCMANLSKFHVVFSSCTLHAFEGHLCQTVNNLCLLSPLRKRRIPQHIKHIRNTRVSQIPTFDKPCSSTLHPLNFVTVKCTGPLLLCICAQVKDGSLSWLLTSGYFFIQL